MSEPTQVQKWSRLVDGVLLLVIPTVLVVVHFVFPSDVHEEYLFRYRNVELVAVWTSAFLHTSNAHLYSNLAGYLIAVYSTHSLYVGQLQYRRRFWITLGTLLIIVPPITAAVDYVVLYRHAGVLADNAMSAGFSGVVSSIGGMLLAALGFFLADEYTPVTGIHGILLVVLTALGVLVAANGVLTPMIAGLLALGVVLQGVEFVSWADIQTPSRIRTRIESNATQIAQVVGYGTVVCVFIYVIFPFDIVQGGAFVNILAHGTGFVSGSVCTALLTVIGRS